MLVNPPVMRDDIPRYPPLLQLLRVTATRVGALYTAVVQQLRTDTQAPRDREPCLALDVNGFGLPPGYYLGRLSGSSGGLPVYEVTGMIGTTTTTSSSAVPNYLTLDLTNYTVTINNTNFTFTTNNSNWTISTGWIVTFNYPQNWYINQNFTWNFSSTSIFSVTGISTNLWIFAMPLEICDALEWCYDTITLQTTVTNDLDLTALTFGGRRVVYRVTSNGSFDGTISGIKAFADQQLIALVNIQSGNTVTLSHQSASSLAANRFYCPGGVDYVIAKLGGVLLWKDPVATAGWRVIDPSPGTTSSGGSGSFIYGDGNDGALTFDGVATVLGMVPAANVYTMTRDITATNITVSAGVTLNTANFRVFATGTVTNSGTIGQKGGTGGNGSAGAGGSSGTQGTGNVTGTYSQAFGNIGGGGGSNASGSIGGSNGGTGYGSAGGIGGAATNPAGAGGGAATAPSAQNGTIHALPQAYAPYNLIGSTQWRLGGGAGGGGASNSASCGGGGGGGGGGNCFIAANTLNNAAGIITAAGGDGGNGGGTSGNAGGGGGGGGGIVVLITTTLTVGTETAAGGTHGNAFNAGGAGSSGTTGLVLKFAT